MLRLLLLFLCVPCLQVRAQGCSDAGFCSMGVLQAHAPGVQDSLKSKYSAIALSFTAGSGEHGTSIYIPQLELVQTIAGKYTLELKLPFYAASGNAGRHSGIGDPQLTISGPVLPAAGKWRLEGSLGARVSTGRANALNKQGLPLPMPYQNNLGTADLIAGIQLSYGNYLHAAAGWQQPVVQYNDNGYLANNAPAAGAAYNSYFSSRQLQRRGDILLRAEGSYSYRRWALSAGPLLIWHPGKDRITDLQGHSFALDGSEGITLNLSGNISYTAKNIKLDLTAGSPLIVRTYRPDGLTRAWVVTPRLSYIF